jgi:hypothetical protein
MKDKHKRHEKNRMREMGIKVQKTATAMANPTKVVETFKNLSEKAQNKVASVVANQIIQKAGMTKESTQDNLAKYSKIVLSLISAAKYDPTGMGLNKIRQNIMTNLPPDLASFVKEGKTKEEIINFYWGVPEFTKVFEKLGWDRFTLEAMVDEVFK